MSEILCNCCRCNNAPMARHKDYLICDDCVEKYGSYDGAVEEIKKSICRLPDQEERK